MPATIDWGTALSPTTTSPPPAIASRAAAQAFVRSVSIAAMSAGLGCLSSVAMR
ncbi:MULTISPECIES: hypothetical protein [unclassified Streptomyces]|uniref:hypothetical protein n=1 Tax=unclassified Streptomyces TaxID=2593676 RepID=UPI002E2CE035|nr:MULTISPECIES: hypothetical protein [unclassified Streptomyces]